MITLYSTNCPKCRMLEKRLDQIVEFNLETDMDKIIAISKQYNIKSAPILVIDGRAYNFEESMKMVSEGKL